MRRTSVALARRPAAAWRAAAAGPAARAGAAVVALALAAVWPFWIQNVYYHTVALLALIYVLLGLGMNVLMGHAGLVHAGYAAFWGVGAYVVAIFSTKFGLSFWMALPVSVVGAAVLAVLVGIPAIRVSGLYFVLVTLGFGAIFELAMTNWDYVGGPNGLYGIDPPQLGSVPLQTPRQLYWLVLAVTALSVLVMHRVANSRVGRAWNYLREDEVAAQAFGVNPVWSKLQAAVLGAAWAGLAGAFFAVRQTAVAPSSFTFLESFVVILIVSLGGLRSLPGTVVGTVAMIVLPELLRPLAQYRFLVFGAAIVLMMLFRPEGLWPGRARRHEEIAREWLGSRGRSA
ncbi:MAG TPA: branched-chain amino acid ABC transporter permease [Actinomycetota bacterium]|nr:branched-chain amino acid ABC transporter permease [Actinomycetota bacterium]